MSRLAIRGDDADRDAIVALLEATPRMTRLSAEEVDSAITRDIVVIADSREAAMRIAKRRGEDILDIPWWVFTGNNIADLLEVLAFATDEALRRWDCATWVLGGVPETLGDTPIEMRRNSRRVAKGWQALLPNANVQVRPHEYSNYYYSWSTVEAINTEAKRVLRG